MAGQATTGTRGTQRKTTTRELRWRIVTVLLLVSLLPLVLVGAGAWLVFGRLMTDQALAHQRQVVLARAQAIDRYLAERLRALELLSRTTPMVRLADREGLRQAFESLDRSYPEAFVDLGVIGADGTHQAYVGPYDLQAMNYADADWFTRVMSEGIFVSDVFLGFRQVPHCIIAVRQQKDGVAWILRATINSESFNAIVRSGQLGSTGDAFLVSAEGRYQTPPRFGRVLEQAPGTPPVYHGGVRHHRAEREGRAVLEATTWLNGKRWQLVVQQDEAEILGPVNRALVTGALVALLAFALVVVATVLSTWHLTATIERTTQQRDALSQELLRSAKLASLGELATGLAHEINNPLAIISAEQTNIADEIGASDLPSDIKQVVLDAVARCKRQVERCGGITGKMLQFGRKTDSRPRRSDIRPVLLEVQKLLGRQAAVRNISLTVDAPTDLPDLVVDGNELEQVLINLVNNAIQAIEGGGSIQVAARRQRDAVEITVRDDGGGIAPADLERIFQPFFTTKPVGQGTGLGLSVCYGIVSGWGGTIEAASEVGRGTEMIVRIPTHGEAPVTAGSRRAPPALGERA